MKIGVAAVCALAVKADNSWKSDSTCLSATTSSKLRFSERDDQWNCDDYLCGLTVLSTVSDSASFGEVAAALFVDCVNPDWNYSESLCEEVISELFENNDVT